jgi:hypothetical protein
MRPHPPPDVRLITGVALRHRESIHYVQDPFQRAIRGAARGAGIQMPLHRSRIFDLAIVVQN